MTTASTRARLRLPLLAIVWLVTDHSFGAPLPETTVVAPVRFETRGKTVFADFGQDVYGRLRVTLAPGNPPGNLVVRLGEKLGADGTIDRHPGGSVSFLATIPTGTTAQLELPLPNGAAAAGPVRLNGQPVAFRVERGAVVVDPVPARHQVLEQGAGG